MSEEVTFVYRDGFCQDFVYIRQKVSEGCCWTTFIPITAFIDWEIDEFDIWYDEIYEKCPNRNTPEEYMTLDDYYKNPDNPKMTKNTKKHEFCLEKSNTDDYSCCFDECPKRN